MGLDSDKVAEAAIALLSLTMFNDGATHRAWKGMDWDVLDDLFERGWIHDPKGKNKSVVFTEDGRGKALECQTRLLHQAAQPGDAADRPSAGR
ncbi:MAG: hypothetical protein ACI82F_004701 [Planctomycetota bacterium]|jgi:hypothetical protein